MSANVWPLLRFGRDDRALLSLRDAYEREPNPSHIMELGVAYLWASDYGAAFEHFAKVNREYTHSFSAFYAMAGAAKWCLKSPQEAVTCWIDGLDCQFADAAGGVSLPLLLLFGSVVHPDLYSQDEAKRLLSLRADDRRIGNWPGPIAEFVLGRIDQELLRSKCNGYNDSDTKVRNWLADFYVAAAGRSRGDESTFSKAMSDTALISDDDFDPTKIHFLAKLWHTEFFLARHESMN